MEIKRDLYLGKLITRKHNGLIKVVTGIRRCGKSYLLNTLFYNIVIYIISYYSIFVNIFLFNYVIFVIIMLYYAGR